MGEKNGFLPYPKGFSTLAIHEAQEPEQWESMAIVTPLTTSTTYKQFGPNEYKNYEYGRSDNPTRNVLEKLIAAMENGKYGSCFSSGLGATTALIGLLKCNQHIVSVNDLYGGTNRLFAEICRDFGIDVTFVEPDNAEFEKAIKSNTKMIFVETPTNPTLKMCDLAALSKIAKKHNIILAVDNTFLTPFLQRPLDFGVDIVMHSITKYMNGHSDVIMGATVTNDEGLYKRIKHKQNGMGIVPSPFDCYQVLRSLKTLELRMRRHSESSLEIAKWLEKHPKVEKVIHPGLPSHPRHELAKRQTSGHSGMIALYIKGGLKESKAFLKALKVITLAVSVGGANSLVEIPSLQSHHAVSQEEKDQLKISENFLRISIGLEDVEDLINDLGQAFDKI